MAVDLDESLRRLGIPVLEGGTSVLPDDEGEEEEEAVAAQADDEAEGPPREALERMVQERLTPVPGVGEIIPTEEDIERAVRQLREVLPELFEE